MSPNSREPQSEPAPSLDELARTCWDSLVAGAERARHPFHTGVLGTGSGDGCDLRTVVLRRTDREGRTLTCHTDRRSSKIAQIRSSPATSWLFYDDPKKVQLRLYGTSTVHTNDDLALERWHSSPPRSRRCYSVEPGPGAPIEHAGSGLAEDLLSRIPTLEESERWRDRFAAIVTQVDRMEWLYLRAQGHLRARFDWSDGACRATWVIP